MFHIESLLLLKGRNLPIVPLEVFYFEMSVQEVLLSIVQIS